MPGTIPAARQHLIDAIAKETRGARSAPAPLAAFARDYYHGVDESDLRATQPASLGAAAAGHLRFGARRKPGQALVRVFNPMAARDGWESARTVVEIVTDDMPFLVDSLATVLNGSGLSIHTMVHPVLGVTRDRAGRIKTLSSRLDSRPAESRKHIEVDRAGDSAQLERLRERIEATLDDESLHHLCPGRFGKRAGGHDRGLGPWSHGKFRRVGFRAGTRGTLSFIILILFLLFRPTGIMGKRGYE